MAGGCKTQQEALSDCPRYPTLALYFATYSSRMGVLNVRFPVDAAPFSTSMQKWKSQSLPGTPYFVR